MTSPLVIPVAPRSEDDGPLRPGTRFGKFNIIKRIGQGGYASVYHAFDTILQRNVAIKVLHRVGGVSADMLRRGVVEAQLMCQLHHENIVKVYDANITDDGQLYLVMELLLGRTLFQVLRHYERLAVEEVYSIGIQIADAVETAHRSGAIHRDLKPENVFITEGNVVKVLDFGIAKVVHGVRGNTTRPDAIQGTLLYMSPEQISAHKLTGRSDIYALGCILFESLSGTHPCLLKNPDPDMLAVAWLQAYEIPPALDSIAPYCPRHLSRIISQSLAKRADERQSSMLELKEALEASLARYLSESGGGELHGQVRSLAGTTSSEKTVNIDAQAVVPALLPGTASVEPHNDARQEGVPGSSERVRAVKNAEPSVNVVPPTPPRSGFEIPRGKRLLIWIVVLLVVAPIGGAVVAGGLAKLYLAYRQPKSVPTASASSTVSAEPVVETPSVTPAPIAPPVVSPPEAVASVAPPAPSASVVSAPVASSSVNKAVVTRPVTRTKKNDSSNARLRAVEAEFNKGTFNVSPH
jgi:serine/threonine protein kinase